MKYSYLLEWVSRRQVVTRIPIDSRLAKVCKIKYREEFFGGFIDAKFELPKILNVFPSVADTCRLFRIVYGATRAQDKIELLFSGNFSKIPTRITTAEMLKYEVRGPFFFLKKLKIKDGPTITGTGTVNLLQSFFNKKEFAMGGLEKTIIDANQPTARSHLYIPSNANITAIDTKISFEELVRYWLWYFNQLEFEKAQALNPPEQPAIKYRYYIGYNPSNYLLRHVIEPVYYWHAERTAPPRPAPIKPVLLMNYDFMKSKESISTNKLYTVIEYGQKTKDTSTTTSERNKIKKKGREQNSISVGLYGERIKNIVFNADFSTDMMQKCAAYMLRSFSDPLIKVVISELVSQNLMPFDQTLIKSDFVQRPRILDYCETTRNFSSNQSNQVALDGSVRYSGNYSVNICLRGNTTGLRVTQTNLVPIYNPQELRMFIRIGANISLKVRVNDSFNNSVVFDVPSSTVLRDWFPLVLVFKTSGVQNLPLFVNNQGVNSELHVQAASTGIPPEEILYVLHGDPSIKNINTIVFEMEAPSTHGVWVDNIEVYNVQCEIANEFLTKRECEIKQNFLHQKLTYSESNDDLTSQFLDLVSAGELAERVISID